MNFDNVTFDSQEEIYFYWYLKELEEAGIISNITYQPKPFLLASKKSLMFEQQLKTKSKAKEITLFSEHSYQADFMFWWNDIARNKMFIRHNDILTQSFKNFPFIANSSKEIISSYSVVDVKGTFNQNNMHRIFSIDQKWIFQQFGVYIQKIITHPSINKKGKMVPASALFPNTFLPARFSLTDIAIKARKIKYNYLTLKEYLDLNDIR